MGLIFDRKDSAQRHAYFDASRASVKRDLNDRLRRKIPFGFPDLSERDVVKHFAQLASKNFSLDEHFYPLGSCTMKYNPKACEKAAAHDHFLAGHPHFSMFKKNPELSEGLAELICRLEEALCDVCGMDSFSLLPMAGAHGELAGTMIAKAYFAEKGEERRFVVIPDSAHGTNPASAGLCGYEVLVVPSGVDGCIDLDAFEKMMSRDVALVMLTCPNTLGIFEPNIDKICAIAHEHGALTYYDGANLNAVMGRFRPGDAGFDIMHTNLHKTFAAPHGGGGPGAGPVGVKKHLEPYLPMPRARKVDDEYIFIHEGRKSIGRVTSALGNVQVLIKAYAYILMLGGAGLKDASEKAVLNARYIAESLKGIVPLAYDAPCAHECVFSLKTFAERGATATDAAKYLIDRGIHPPTVYFPLIAKEAFMVEPTETESKATLDEFVACMKDWVGIVESDPAKVKEFPLSMSVRRVDELKAAKDLNLRHHCCE